MSYRLWVLFVCNLCLWSMGNGLLPLLPIYALERGATATTAGAALACAYAAVAGSNLLASVLAGALRSRKRMLVVAGLFSVISFDIAAIGGTMAAGALASLPLLPLVGTLSDRLGRRRFLAAAYLVGGLGTLVLAFAATLWQFWLASALLSLAVTASGAVMSALAVDLLPANALTIALPRITAMGWIAAVIGFAGGGYLLEQLGLFAVAAGAFALAALAAGLLALLPRVHLAASGRPQRSTAQLRQSNPEV